MEEMERKDQGKGRFQKKKLRDIQQEQKETSFCKQWQVSDRNCQK